MHSALEADLRQACTDSTCAALQPATPVRYEITRPRLSAPFCPTRQQRNIHRSPAETVLAGLRDRVLVCSGMSTGKKEARSLKRR